MYSQFFVNKYSEKRQARGEKGLICLAVAPVGSCPFAPACAAKPIITADLALIGDGKALFDKIGRFSTVGY